MNKSEITREEAIADCKKIWALIFEGKCGSKYEALAELPDLTEKYDSLAACPLCCYAMPLGGCDNCPYYQKYHVKCDAKGFHFRENPRRFAQRIMEL